MDGPSINGNSEEDYTRPPTIEDLLNVCRLLNQAKARYAIIGGMAMNHYGFLRGTHDIDFLVDDDPVNIECIIAALSQLPDGAASEIKPSDIKDYSVIRINDEITIDLLGSACSVSYNDAEATLIVDTSLGEHLPFASPAILLKTKDTIRESDKRDRAFLEAYLAMEG
jgi:hypothetical protein